MTYGIPNCVLNDNGPQFIGKAFTAACVALGTQLMTVTGYYPRTIGQTE